MACRHISIFLQCAARSLGSLLLAYALTACSTLAPEVSDPRQVGSDAVLLVGKIEIVPPITKADGEIKIGLDPFNVKGAINGRVLLGMGERPVRTDSPSYSFNPRVGETFFYAVPRSMPYVVFGQMIIAFDGSATQIMRVPTPIALDLRAGDRVAYVGTWRLHRDEFYSVTRVEVLDQQSQAAADARKRFGSDVQMRRASAQLMRN